MSVFGENYKKINEGYNKILACIESLNDENQLICISNMTNNWVNLADTYCDQIYEDKSVNWRLRRKNTNVFGDAVKEMFDSINESFKVKSEELNTLTLYEREYEGKFKPVKIKNLYEMM